MLTQITWDQLVLTCVGWPNGEKLRRLAYKFELDRSQRKSKQVDISGRPNEIQVERKFSTGVSAWPVGLKKRRKRKKNACGLLMSRVDGWWCLEC